MSREIVFRCRVGVGLRRRLARRFIRGVIGDNAAVVEYLLEVRVGSIVWSTGGGGWHAWSGGGGVCRVIAAVV